MEKRYITINGISQCEMLGSQTLNYFCLYAISKRTGHEVAISTAPHCFQGIIPECFDTPFSLFPQNVPCEIFHSKLCHNPEIEEDLYKLDLNHNYDINACFYYGYLYWKDILPELKTKFKIKSKFLEEAQNIINDIGRPTACLNFRRGTYPLYMDNYMDYYKRALEQIPNDVVLLLLSEDFNWINSSKELQQLVEGREVVRANFLNYVQLSLLSLCDYNVCCPSSFCILGSILSTNPKQVVMFPYLSDAKLHNTFFVFRCMVNETFPSWLQIKF